jgi:hypothetical protein
LFKLRSAMAKEELPESLLRKLSEAGRRGGKRCLETMTVEERAERSRKGGVRSGEVRRKKARAKRAAASE